MADMQLLAGTDEAREHVTIELQMDGEPLGHIHLDAPATAFHLEVIAKHRMQLLDEVPPTLDEGSRLIALLDPAWNVTAAPGGGAALALRHPGLGWLGFVFPPDEVGKLRQALADRSTPPQT